MYLVGEHVLVVTFIWHVYRSDRVCTLHNTHPRRGVEMLFLCILSTPITAEYMHYSTQCIIQVDTSAAARNSPDEMVKDEPLKLRSGYQVKTASSLAKRRHGQ